MQKAQGPAPMSTEGEEMNMVSLPTFPKLGGQETAEIPGIHDLPRTTPLLYWGGTSRTVDTYDPIFQGESPQGRRLEFG